MVTENDGIAFVNMLGDETPSAMDGNERRRELGRDWKKTMEAAGL